MTDKKQEQIRAHEASYPYNLGNYRAYKGKIYKKVWWFIYKCINKGPYSFLEGVRIVNDLCGAERRRQCPK